MKSAPDIPPDYFIPICLMLWVSYFLLWSNERRGARKVLTK